MRQAERASPIIAYVWTPYFATAVARRAGPQPGPGPLALLDERGRVLAADAAATAAGVLPGLSERQAATRCPGVTLLPASRFPLWEAQERFLEQIRGYGERWQPAGLGRAYLQAPITVAPTRVAVIADELPAWCQAVAAAVRALGWRPALGATGGKFGALVAGQAAGEDAGLLLAPAAQRGFLAGQPVELLPLDVEALAQLRYLGIRTLGQFARLPAAGVLARFGEAGRTAQRWAQGLDDRPVIPPWETPEVSARAEFDPPLADRERLLAALMGRVERLLTALRGRLQAAGQIRLQITRGDTQTLALSHIFPLPTAAAEPIRLALAGLLARVAWDGEAAAEAVVTLAGITDAPVRQLMLFDPAADDHRRRLTALLEQLAARFGADAFRLASLADPDGLLLERRPTFLPWR